MKFKSYPWLSYLALASLPFHMLAAPATHVQSVTYNSETITLRLTLQNLRGSEFELWTQNAAGTYDVQTPVAERSYLGTVDEYPGAVSYGVMQDDGKFRGGVIFDRGEGWWTLDSAVTKVRGDVAPFSFGFPDYSVDAGQGGTTTYGFDLGIDARYNYYNIRGGGSIAKTFEHIEYSVAGIRALYMSNALLRPYLARVIIRTDDAQDPANGTTWGTYLDAVRAEWNTNHTSADRDLVAGVTTNSVGGGLAWVGVVGTNSGYSVNDSDADGDFSIVGRHEIGHNWGLSHFDGGAPEGATINSGNAFGRFSGPELKKALDHRDIKLADLDNEGTYTAVNLPPYASIDGGIMTQVLESSISIAVMANDHDANGHTLSISSFDSTSAQGGTITQQSQNLVYTPPSGAFLGSDTFTYVITDSSGQRATGVVGIDVQPDHSLRLYLPMDETSGTTLSNLSSFGSDAAFQDNDLSASTVTGQYGNAVDLDGTGDYASVSGVNLTTNTVTLTGWIKPASAQKDNAGIIFDRSGSHGKGIHIKSDRTLRYHWGSGGIKYTWDSGLVVPTDTWTFVALVIEPNQARMYMNIGTGFQTATNVATHNADTFETIYIGADPNHSSRRFDGSMDDIRMYDIAMSQTILQTVMDGGGASSPRPVDGATGVADRTLSWAPGSASTDHEIFIGTDSASVSNATPSDPEYAGSTSEAFFEAILGDNTTYYWRVDTVTPSTTIKGDVWSFTTGTIDQPTFPLRMYLPMEETSGTILSNLSGSGSDASFQNNNLSSSTVTGVFGNAVDFDGSGDYASVTGMDFTTNTVTLTAWIKAAASQSDFSGILFDNSGDNMLGLNIQSNRTLRYHWGGLSVWAWDSGLIVPADTWTFVALVIEPDQATIYMNTGSGFVSATNTAAHGLDTFTSPQVARVTGWGGRFFDGSVDEARIFEGAMSETDLQQVFQGSGALKPQPADEATGIIESDLTWLSGAGSTSDQIYLGTNKTEVLNATPSDPEYQETSGTSTYSATLANNTTYYWRVDTVTSSGTLTGNIWSFSTGVFPVNDYPPMVNAGEDQTAIITGGTSWTPNSLTLTAWYDASDTGTLPLSGAVDQWEDKSGNNNHVVQGTSSQRPSTGSRAINGLNVLDHDGGDYMEKGSFAFPAGGNVSVFLVAEVDGINSQYDSIFSVDAAVDFQFDAGNSNSFNGRLRGDIPQILNFSDGPFTGPRIFNAIFDRSGGSLSGYVDGTNRGTDNTYTSMLSASQHLRIFGNRNGSEMPDGAVAEVILLEDCSDATRLLIEGYLAHKWGLENNLPGTHPHFSAPPGGGGVSVNLDATVSDADGQTPTTTWTQVSGEGTVVFGDPSAVDTTAFFPQAGTYVLQLEADDGVHQTTDTLEIVVEDQTDSDADGMYDVWEIANFGNLTTANSTSDTDTDGASDVHEFQASTDPNDDTSLLKVTVVTASAQQHLQSTRVTGKYYRVSWRASLMSGNWSTVTGQEGWSASDGSPLDLIVTTPGFYRIEVSDTAFPP